MTKARDFLFGVETPTCPDYVITDEHEVRDFNNGSRQKPVEFVGSDINLEFVMLILSVNIPPIDLRNNLARSPFEAFSSRIHSLE